MSSLVISNSPSVHQHQHAPSNDKHCPPIIEGKRKQYTYRQRIDIIEERVNSDVSRRTKDGWDCHFALAAVNLGYGDYIKLVRTR